MRVQVVFYSDGDTIIHIGIWTKRFDLKHVDQAAKAIADYIKGDNFHDWDDSQAAERHEPVGELGSFRVWDLMECHPESWVYALEFLYRHQTDDWENQTKFFRALVMEITCSD